MCCTTVSFILSYSAVFVPEFITLLVISNGAVDKHGCEDSLSFKGVLAFLFKWI